MKFFLFAVCIHITLAFGISSVNAQTQSLTLIHAGLPGSLFDISTAELGRRLKNKLPETYRLSIIANPALGDSLALLDSVKNGRATFALTSSAMVAISDHFAIFELPFLIRNRKQVRAIRGALLNDYLQPEAAQKGFHILGVWENGFHQLTNDLHPIRQPNDLRGLKIALPPANPWREKLIRKFGADPMATAPRALAKALRTQIVDGQEAPLAEIAAMDLTRTQRHLTLSDHLYSPAFLVSSQANLEAVPQAVRAIIASEIIAMEAWIQNTAIRLESDLIDRLDKNMELSQIDIDAFKAVSRSLYGDFIRAVPGGAKMITIMQAAGEGESFDQKVK